MTVSRGANCVGAYQYPEKVVPLFATNALLDLPLPVYGDGKQRRDYQHVLDTAQASRRSWNTGSRARFTTSARAPR